MVITLSRKFYKFSFELFKVYKPLIENIEFNIISLLLLRIILSTAKRMNFFTHFLIMKCTFFNFIFYY